MRKIFILLFSLVLFFSCAAQRTKQAEAPKIPLVEKPRFSVEYLEVLTFVSKNQRKIISNIVDGRGTTLRSYAKKMGININQYVLFKRVLGQNLPKLIQYNEPDAFQARVQEILRDKKVIVSDLSSRSI